MRPLALLPALLLATCGEEGGGNDAAPPGPPGPVQTATLTGLYEGGPGDLRSQMCVIDTRFGLVVRTSGERSCSGTGTVIRDGGSLRLAMAGAENCTIEARIDGRRVVFAPTQPAGCAYYCAAGAGFAGASLDKIGGAEGDALRARDLVGGRLCG